MATSTLERRTLVALSALIVPGSGHALRGRWRRGAAFTAVVAVALGLAPFFGPALVGLGAIAWLAGLVDATFLMRTQPDEPELLAALATWGVAFAASAGALVAVQAFVARVYPVASSAMLPTLEKGDVVVVDRLSSFRVPARGDVIVYRDPKEKSKQLAKRVVGLPGDKIAVQGATLLVNDKPVPQRTIDENVVWRADGTAHAGILLEETLDGATYRVVHDKVVSARDFPGPEDDNPYLVPDDHVFVLGDDRENSQDSRFSGAVPLEDVRGRARWVLFARGEEGKVRWGRVGARVR